MDHRWKGNHDNGLLDQDICEFHGIPLHADHSGGREKKLDGISKLPPPDLLDADADKQLETS